MKFTGSILLLAAAGTPGTGARNRWGEFSLRQKQDWYASPEARAIADSVTQDQSPPGGWPKSTDLAQPPRSSSDIPQPGQVRANSIDNDATTMPMQFPALVEHTTGEGKYKNSFRRGLDFLFAAQYPNGGWLRFYPLREGYYSHITFHDGAMIHVMELLRRGLEPSHLAPPAFRVRRPAF